MSIWDEDVDDEGPPMNTEEGRDEWIDILLEADEWAEAIVVQKGSDMVARFRWSDGRQEVFDLLVRRQMEVVIPAGDEGSN